MEDQVTVTIFCFLLAMACSFTTAFFYELSVGKMLRRLKRKAKLTVVPNKITKKDLTIV